MYEITKNRQILKQELKTDDLVKIKQKLKTDFKLKIKQKLKTEYSFLN